MIFTTEIDWNKEPQNTPGPWRVPTVIELIGLVNYAKADVAMWLMLQGFINVQSVSYWSSTSYAGYTSLAWIVSMYDGGVGAFGKSNGYYVWPVRSGHGAFGPSVVEAKGRFTDNGDGSITDNLTGLQWMKDANKFDRMTWQEAAASVSGLNDEEVACETGCR